MIKANMRHAPELGRALLSRRLGPSANKKHACALIRAGGHCEIVAGVSVTFTPSMLAGQYAYTQIRQASTGLDTAAIRDALDALWSVRHYFELQSATGFALGLAHIDRVDAPSDTAG